MIEKGCLSSVPSIWRKEVDAYLQELPTWFLFFLIRVLFSCLCLTPTISFDNGSAVVSDEQLVMNTTAPVAPEPAGNAATSIKVSRTHEMDSRANAAARAAERRLAQAKSDSAESAGRGPSTSTVASPPAVKPKENEREEEDESSARLKRSQEYIKRMREKTREQKAFREVLMAERLERFQQQEELRLQREAERSEREARQKREQEEAESHSDDGNNDDEEETVQLRLRTVDGEVTRKRFRASDTLRTVLTAVLFDNGMDDSEGYSLLVPFPTREFIDDALDTTLSSAGLVPCGTVSRMLSFTNTGRRRRGG